jgi:hypothetical protein
MRRPLTSHVSPRLTSRWCEVSQVDDGGPLNWGWGVGGLAALPFVVVIRSALVLSCSRSSEGRAN